MVEPLAAFRAIGRSSEHRAIFASPNVAVAVAALMPLPRNDNFAGGGHCPSCHARTSVAPATSEYRGRGLIHHHWQCDACGHQWITASHVSG
jgi:hypothetical protein